jgi:hypothetical protein
MLSGPGGTGGSLLGMGSVGVLAGKTRVVDAPPASDLVIVNPVPRPWVEKGCLGHCIVKRRNLRDFQIPKQRDVTSQKVDHTLEMYPPNK